MNAIRGIQVEALLDRPFAIDGPEAFNALAMDLFRLHAANNPVYRGFLEGLSVDPGSITSVEDIPCIPIQVFRNHRVILEGLDPTCHFTSSGTTSATTSTHHVPWPRVYERSFMSSFLAEYGKPEEIRILALLPSYMEREGSSLVYMAQHLIAATEDPLSGTYLYKHDELASVLDRSETEGKRTILLGVTFALLDHAEKYPRPLKHTTLIETGGMKGRRPEIVREELHRVLMEAFSLDAVHSEYGMTELLSQAWSSGSGLYRCPPWMQVRIRETNDPLGTMENGRTGGINVIDLANITSCPFIATQDLGRAYADGSFEVLGRFDHSDVRGCNLLV